MKSMHIQLHNGRGMVGGSVMVVVVEMADGVGVGVVVVYCKLVLVL